MQTTATTPSSTPASPPVRPAYVDQDCPLTLREGLDQFAAMMPDLLPTDTDTEVGKLLRAHDCCHILFGLTTQLGDEVLADTWTLAGTDVTLRQYSKWLKQDEFTALFKEIGYGKIVFASLKSLPRIFKAIARARRMTEKWSMFGYEEHLDTPLRELRKRYNIAVLPAL